jgi:hypothetical protein
MNDSTTHKHFSPRAFLAAIGFLLRMRHVWKPVQDNVVIPQKTIQHTPLEKLQDAFITILAGARGMVEVEKRLRNDPTLQHAFGRERCAEQSSIQDTLDACTEENVVQMQQAFVEIYRKHSLGYGHDYHTWQLIDADMMGMVCGEKAQFATKGYFAQKPHRRGRQLARCIATNYHEILAEQLYDGRRQLQTALIPLLEQAGKVLELDDDKRAKTVVRVDSGGGTKEDINWILAQGYAYHGKDFSGLRAKHLAETVTEWIDDPKCAGRQVGWIPDADHPYVRPVVRIAARCRKANGQWAIGVLVSTLTGADVIALTGQPCHRVHDATAVLLAYVYFYDARGGGVETINKEDKQGLGLTARNKKRFVAQQMLVLLAGLAHNVIVWVHRWLSGYTPKLIGYGILRMVRDVFTTSGFLQTDSHGRLEQVVLNGHDPLAKGLVDALRGLFQQEHVVVNSGET